MSEEIFPCPHCGCAEIHFTNHGRIGRGLEHRGDAVWSMCCYDCGATFPNMYNKEGLVAKWNRRVTTAPAKGTDARPAALTDDQILDLVVEFAPSHEPDPSIPGDSFNALGFARDLLATRAAAPREAGIDAQRLQRWKPKGVGGQSRMLSDNKGKYVKYSDLLALIAPREQTP